MSSQHDPLEPTPFDVAPSAPAQEAGPGQKTTHTTPGWVLPALGGLLLLAAVVVFWLPERVAPPAPVEPPAGTTAPLTGEPTAPAIPTPQTTTARPATGQPAPTAEDATPWSEAQQAKLRKEAQDVLQELLDVQFSLEERGVRQWAPEPFAAAGELAASGDELYKTREYEAARARYEESLDAFLALEQSIPARLEEQLEAARLAIEEGDIEAANSALAMASLIEAGTPELETLGQRARVLPELLGLLEQAAAAEATGDLAGAEEFLQQAAALDPAHQRVAAELERVAAAHLEQRFNDAMSDGYLALDEGHFDSARKAFRAAARLNSGSAEAASALQEVDAAETAYRLSSLKRQGAALEGREQWQQAVAAYEKAQGIDASVLFASEGLQRSRGRARLDKQLRKILDEPDRLSDVAVAEATEQLLGQARRITPRGPLLERQLGEVQVLLDQANTPVTVTLRSDLETEVIVYRVARLGRFQERQLTLRPGTYVAVGTRNGYRDVRQEIVVLHNAVPTPITIACVEKI